MKKRYTTQRIRMIEKRNVLRLIVSISLPLIAGYIGSMFTTANISPWYDGLAKPPLTAPGSLIGIIWTVLYILMGISLFLVWNKETKKIPEQKAKKNGLVIFGIQLLFNMSWSIFFFGLRTPWLGVAIIIPLIILISMNIYLFHKVEKKAAYLLLPYIAWVCFATYLNIGIAVLN